MNNDWREYTCDQDYLAHHGILGQKWGVRRFESANGHLTAAGKARYDAVDGKYQKLKAAKSAKRSASLDYNKKFAKAYNASTRLNISQKRKADRDRKWDEAGEAAKKSDLANKAYKNAKTDYKFEKKIQKMDRDEKRDYVKQVISDTYYGSKTMTALGYGAKEAKGVKNTLKAEKVVRKESNANAVQKTKRNPIVVQDIEKKAIKSAYKAATKPINGDGYYGNSNKFKASNGVTVGAPKNKTVEAFRAVQGTKVGGAALNGVAKLNTAFYGHGSAKKTWQKIEEQTRKETAAVQEANRAHKEAERERRRR